MRRRHSRPARSPRRSRSRRSLISPVSLARSFGALVAIGLVVSFVLALTAGAAVVGARAALARGSRRSGAERRRSAARIAQMGGASRRARPDGLGTRVRPPRAGEPARSDREPSGGGVVALRTRLAAIPRAVGSSIVRAAVGAVPACPRLSCGSRGAAWRRCPCPARPGTGGRARLGGGRVGGGHPDRRHVGPGPPAPTDSVEARDLASIERETGTPGDVNVIVRSERLLDPAVVRWMSSYQRRVLRQNGSASGRPCREADLCPALSLTNLFGSGRQSARQIREAVAALPPYFSQNVITPDRRTANIAFRMGRCRREERREVVESLRAELDPPAGVEADLAGPVVTAAAGEDDVASSMWLVTLLALVAVALLLRGAEPSIEAALLVAIPLALAVGWAFLSFSCCRSTSTS